MAVEGCTAWRYVVEKIIAAGFEAHLAEPAETQASTSTETRAELAGVESGLSPAGRQRVGTA